MRNVGAVLAVQSVLLVLAACGLTPPPPGPTPAARPTLGTTFTAKLNQEVTHRGRVEAPMVTAFHEGLAPLVECDRLSHLLAQFRYDFADTPETRAHLERIYDAFGGITTLALELRHNSWQAPDALDFLREMEVTVVHLGEGIRGVAGRQASARSVHDQDHFGPGLVPDASPPGYSRAATMTPGPASGTSPTMRSSAAS